MSSNNNGPMVDSSGAIIGGKVYFNSVVAARTGKVPTEQALDSADKERSYLMCEFRDNKGTGFDAWVPSKDANRLLENSGEFRRFGIDRRRIDGPGEPYKVATVLVPGPD